MNKNRDAYSRFFDSLVSKKEFFRFGLDEIIFPEKGKAELYWEELKSNLQNNQLIYIRNYGSGGKNTHLYQDFYSKAFKHQNIKGDPTNNTFPAKLIETLTGYSPYQKKGYDLIQNYQRSHVFGRTKNALAFTAPWNIVYLPKPLDPFTGHEAKGDSIIEFTQLFQAECYTHFHDMIEDFNDMMNSDSTKENVNKGIEHVAITNELTAKQKQRFSKSVYSEFEPIKLSDNQLK